jgi:hypothetical protein
VFFVSHSGIGDKLSSIAVDSIKEPGPITMAKVTELRSVFAMSRLLREEGSCATCATPGPTGGGDWCQHQGANEPPRARLVGCGASLSARHAGPVAAIADALSKLVERPDETQ